MASISSVIMYNTQQTIWQSQELQQVGSDMKKISNNDIGSVVQRISTAWTGSNSETYVKKLMATQNRISGYADKTSNVAASIENSARRMLIAEQAALDILHK